MKPIDPALWHDRSRFQAQSAPNCWPKRQGVAFALAAVPAHDNGLFLDLRQRHRLRRRRNSHRQRDDSRSLWPDLAETNEPADAMVVADLDLSLIPRSTGRRWLRARRPDLYGPLTMPTGQEQDTRTVRFDRGDKS